MPLVYTAEYVFDVIECVSSENRLSHDGYRGQVHLSSSLPEIWDILRPRDYKRLFG